MTRRQLALAVYVPTFFLAFAQGVVLPTMPLYAKEFDPSLARISIAVAALAFGTMLADMPAGIMLQRMGRRPMMLLGAGLVAASSVGLAIAHAYPELVLYRLIGGFGTACWGVSRLAFMTDAVPIANRGRALSTFGGIQRIGTFAGPATGGFVAGIFDLRASFALAAALAVTATAVSFLFVPETRPVTTVTARGRWRVLGGVLRHHYKDFLGASAAQVFAQMIRSGRQLIVPLYGANVIGLGAPAIGAIVSISAVIDMSLIPSFLVMGLGMAILPFTNSFTTLLIATGIIGLGNGLGSGTMMTLGADLAPREAAGEFLGLWRFVGDAGQMGGPLAVGGIADAAGFMATAFVLAGIGVLTAGTIYVAVQETLQERPIAPVPEPEPRRPAPAER